MVFGKKIINLFSFEVYKVPLILIAVLPSRLHEELLYLMKCFVPDLESSYEFDAHIVTNMAICTECYRKIAPILA